MEKLLLTILLSPVVYLFSTFMRRNRWIRAGFILIHASLLTFLTAFIFSQPGWFWHGELPLSITGRDHSADTADYRTIKDNFIFLDNSREKQLIPDPKGDPRGTTSMMVTNRRILAETMNLLQTSRSNIDMVVCDIDLQDQLPEDTILFKYMDSLAVSNKLLIASAPGDKLNPVLHFEEGLYGNVAEQTSDKLLVSHTIYTSRFSLPYKLYYTISQVKDVRPCFFDLLLKETDSAGDSHLIAKTFQPVYTVGDEGLLYDQDNKEAPTASLGFQKEEYSPGKNIYNLGDILTFNRDEFITQLSDRKKAHKLNIILVGAFTSDNEDVHSTLQGRMHGATILLNVYSQINKKGHYLTARFILILFLSFLLISVVIFYPPRIPTNWREKLPKTKFFHYLDSMLEFLRDELYLLLLIALSIFTEKYSNHAVNIIFLVVYLAVISHLVRYFHSPSNQEHA